MAKKPCPVDRGKLLIGLACCLATACSRCPYDKGCDAQANDALAYIYYLEGQLNAKSEGTD